MRRPGPILLVAGALLMIVGCAGHFGVVWAVGVVLAAGGLAALVAPRSRLAGLALAAVLIAGLGVYPWLAARSATAGEARWGVRASQPGTFALGAATGRRLWSRGVSGVHPLKMSIGGGVVSVIDEPHGLNPFLDGDARTQGDELIVLDARTGEERGSLVAPAGIRGTVALGGGRVLAVDRDGVHRVVG